MTIKRVAFPLSRCVNIPTKCWNVRTDPVPLRAKAYEGYRKEAARLDEAFEARLFSSALSRLEEAPLRLVENTTHGSPWHELISSDAFRGAMESVPELRAKFIEIAKASIATIGRNSSPAHRGQEVNSEGLDNAQSGSSLDAPQAARR